MDFYLSTASNVQELILYNKKANKCLHFDRLGQKGFLNQKAKTEKYHKFCCRHFESKYDCAAILLYVV